MQIGSFNAARYGVRHPPLISGVTDFALRNPREGNMAIFFQEQEQGLSGYVKV